MRLYLVVSLLVVVMGCTPEVKVAVEAPSEPVVVNLNVNIEHKIKVKIDKELDDLITNDSELF